MAKLVTHSGRFHADDVFAYTILQSIFKDCKLVRSRSADDWNGASVLFDVGGKYEPDLGHLDHHMPNPPKRKTGEPYSSAGLVWKNYGIDFLKILFGNMKYNEYLYGTWSKVDTSLIYEIDLADNMTGPSRGPGYISALIEAFNPSWNESVSFDDRFIDAALFAAGILERTCFKALSFLQATQFFQDAINTMNHEKILVLDQPLPWQQLIHEQCGKDIIFVVHPGEDSDNWYVYGVPQEQNSFDVVHPFPASWAGLEGKKLAAVTHVEDAVFCHVRRFVCAAKTRDSALKLAKIALE